MQIWGCRGRYRGRRMKALYWLESAVNAHESLHQRDANQRVFYMCGCASKLHQPNARPTALKLLEGQSTTMHNTVSFSAGISWYIQSLVSHQKAYNDTLAYIIHLKYSNIEQSGRFVLGNCSMHILCAAIRFLYAAPCMKCMFTNLHWITDACCSKFVRRMAI